VIRLAVLSDVHGNLPALEAVLADAQLRGIQGIIVAGDFSGGPEADETVRRLVSFRHWVVRGNSDINLLRYAEGLAPPEWRTSRQYALLRWGHQHNHHETLRLLRSLPEQRVIVVPGTAPIRVVHGSPRDPFEGLSPDEPEALGTAWAQIDEPVLVCGHTHIPWQEEQNGRLTLNPGAVCGPLNGDVRAQYALLTWDGQHWRAERRAVAYDLALISASFRDSGLLEHGGALARAFLLSIQTGRNVSLAFLDHAYGLAAAEGHGQCQVIADEVWDRAALTFDWQIGAG
jgi:putative phosphoesterase